MADTFNTRLAFYTKTKEEEEEEGEEYMKHTKKCYITLEYSLKIKK